MQARYYDPVIGRFYSNDPVDVLGHMQRGNPIHGFSRYTYANNNPYKYTDPDGEFALNLLAGAFSAAIEVGVQLATDGKVTNLTKVGVSFAAGAVGAGLGQKAAQLGSLLSKGSSVAKTGSQFAGDVVEGVANDAIQTNVNNAINSVTGQNAVTDMQLSDPAANSALNTATGNVVSNTTGASGNKKQTLVSAAEGARKIAEAVFSDEN